MNGNGLRVAAAAVIGVLLLGGAYYLFGGRRGARRRRPCDADRRRWHRPPRQPPCLRPALRRSSRHEGHDPGRALWHAFDGSEAAKQPDAEIKRFYLINPDGSGLRESMPGQPTAGKDQRVCRPTGRRWSSQATGSPDQIWLAAIDGSAPDLVDCLPVPGGLSRLRAGRAADRRLALRRYNGQPRRP